MCAAATSLSTSGSGDTIDYNPQDRSTYLPTLQKYSKEAQAAKDAFDNLTPKDQKAAWLSNYWVGDKLTDAQKKIDDAIQKIHDVCMQILEIPCGADWLEIRAILKALRDNSKEITPDNPIFKALLAMLNNPTIVDALCDSYLEKGDENTKLAAELKEFLNPGLLQKFVETEFYKKVRSKISSSEEDVRRLKEATLLFQGADSSDDLIASIAAMKKLADEKSKLMGSKRGEKHLQKTDQGICQDINRDKERIAAIIKNELLKRSPKEMKQLIDGTLNLFHNIGQFSSPDATKTIMLSILSEVISELQPLFSYKKDFKLTDKRLIEIVNELKDQLKTDSITGKTNKIATDSKAGKTSKTAVDSKAEKTRKEAILQRFTNIGPFVQFFLKSFELEKTFYTLLNKAASIETEATKLNQTLEILNLKIQDLPLELQASSQLTVDFLRNIVAMEEPLDLLNEIYTIQTDQVLNPENKNLLLKFLINKIHAKLEAKSWFTHNEIEKFVLTKKGKRQWEEMSKELKQDAIFHELRERYTRYLDVLLADPSRENLIKFYNYIDEKGKTFLNVRMIDEWVSKLPELVTWSKYERQLMQLRTAITGLIPENTIDIRDRTIEALIASLDACANLAFSMPKEVTFSIAKGTSIQNALEERYGDCHYDERLGKLFLIKSGPYGEQFYFACYTISQTLDSTSGIMSITVTDKKDIKAEKFHSLNELYYTLIKDEKNEKNAKKLIEDLKKLSPEERKAFYFQIPQTFYKQNRELPNNEFFQTFVNDLVQNLKKKSTDQMFNDIADELAVTTTTYFIIPEELPGYLADLKSCIGANSFHIDGTRPFSFDVDAPEYGLALFHMKRIFVASKKISPAQFLNWEKCLKETLFSELNFKERNNLLKICTLFLDGSGKDALSSIELNPKITRILKSLEKNLREIHETDPEWYDKLHISLSNSVRNREPQFKDLKNLTEFELTQCQFIPWEKQKAKTPIPATEGCCPQFEIWYDAFKDVHRGGYSKLSFETEKPLGELPKEFHPEITDEKVRHATGLYLKVLEYLSVEKVKRTSTPLTGQQKLVLHAMTEKICGRLHQARLACTQDPLMADVGPFIWERGRLRASIASFANDLSYNISVNENGDVLIKYSTSNACVTSNGKPIGNVETCAIFKEANLVTDTTVEEVRNRFYGYSSQVISADLDKK